MDVVYALASTAKIYGSDSPHCAPNLAGVGQAQVGQKHYVAAVATLREAKRRRAGPPSPELAIDEVDRWLHAHGG